MATTATWSRRAPACWPTPSASAFAPATTRARLARAVIQIQLELDAHDEAQSLLQTVIVDAAQLGDRAQGARAAAHLMALVGTRQQRVAEVAGVAVCVAEGFW